MSTYAFILGRKHLLSTAELCHTLGSAKIVDLCPSALFARFDQQLENPQSILDRLGGTIKIAEIFHTATPSELPSATDIIADHLIRRFEGAETKFKYALSTLNLAGRHDIFLKRTLTALKKKLQAAGLKSRFINKNFKNPESAALKGEKILETGAEILVIQTHRNLYFAETRALQDFENYSRRDYERPERDAHLGMLPPKLAQIMLNLTGLQQLNTPPSTSPTIYDPFCGIGTVLTEALLMGWNVVGSDIQAGVVQKSQKNIDHLVPSGPTRRLFAKDATALTTRDLPEKIDAIVTETYLGPPVSQFPSPENLEKTFKNVRATILGFMQAVHPFLKPGTPVVLSLLVYRRSDRFFFLEKILEPLRKIGFEAEPLIPYNLIKTYHLKVFDRPSLVYDRPDQIVGREIWKFVRR